jgi:hypothetical protein
MVDLLNKDKKANAVRTFELALAKYLGDARKELGSEPDEILTRAGVWFDVPKPPDFNKLEDLLIDATKESVAITKVFPITSWIQAYISYRYQVRVFSFSEYMNETKDATRYALREVLKIEDPKFIDAVKQARA